MSSADDDGRSGGLGSVALVRPILLVATVAAVALLAVQVVPLLGAAAIGLILGVLLRTLAPPRLTIGIPAKLGPRALQVSIVALGLGVNLALVASVAVDSLVVMLVTLAIGLGAILVVGRRLGVEPAVTALLAAGTAICGASAIAAVAPVIGASGRQISRSVAVIFAFNLTAVALFPIIAHAIGLPAPRYAVWAGTAVNDTSSVLAAAFAYGSDTVAAATTVKLARTLMIVPVVLLFAALAPRLTEARPDAAAGSALAGRVATRRGPLARLRLVPMFVVAFLAGAALNTLGLVPTQLATVIPQIAQLGTVVALSAIGLTVDLRSFAGSGSRPIVLGLIGWVVVASSSLVLIQLVGGLRT
jgi:uncharacterized integral membrane protein (TIGR00698 family)